MTRSVKNKISRYGSKSATARKRKRRPRKSAKRVASKNVRRRVAKHYTHKRCSCGKTLTTHLVWSRHVRKCPMVAVGWAARLYLDGMITRAEWKHAETAANQWRKKHPEWKPRKRYQT